MFKIAVLQVVVAVAVAGPIYPGGMGYGGMGTSTVSVRRTSVLSPGMYGGGMMPGMGVGMVSSMYGGGMGLALVDGKSVIEGGEGAVEETIVEEKKETVLPNLSTSETVIEKQVETPMGEVDETVEVVKTMDTMSPMGLLRTGAVGGIVAPGVVGTEADRSSRTNAVRAGLGGVEKSSIRESQVSTPVGSESSVSSTQQTSRVLL